MTLLPLIISIPLPYPEYPILTLTVLSTKNRQKVYTTVLTTNRAKVSPLSLLFFSFWKVNSFFPFVSTTLRHHPDDILHLVYIIWVFCISWILRCFTKCYSSNRTFSSNTSDNVNSIYLRSGWTDKICHIQGKLSPKIYWIFKIPIFVFFL